MSQNFKPCGRLSCQIFSRHIPPCDIPSDPPKATPDAVRLTRPEYLLEALRRALRLIDGWEHISVSEHLSEIESLRAIADPPTAELQLDRRELASIRAGLRLLQWANGPDRKILPFSIALDVHNIAGRCQASCFGTSHGAIEPLTAAEIDELVRRLA